MLEGKAFVRKEDLDIDNLQKILNEKFKLSEFRLGQKEIIESVLRGKDVLALMPTGGGKSLCYQLPAMMAPGLTIVVSPLIALMNDQVTNLNHQGIPAGCIHSGMSFQERKSVFKAMTEKGSYILYLSPERIQKSGFAPWLTKQKVNLFAIDEAHCISHWGHDFRTEYSEIKLLREIHPNVPMMALTATATPLVKNDIIRQLNLKDPDQHVYGFYRPNLYYQVEFCEDEMDKENLVLAALSKAPTGRVIIYCGTRKSTEEWADLLALSGEKVAFYHAGLASQDRVKLEAAYQSGEVRVLTATNAFGMGIDHPDVRLVVHTQMPGNIESYYQEVGRAGRDGLPSTCLLTYSKKDKGLQSFFINSSDASPKIKAQRWSALNAMIQYAEGSECRHGDILTYFKDKNRISRCGHCDSCAPKTSHRVLVPNRPKIIKKSKKKDVLLKSDIPAHDLWKVEVIREWRKEFAKKNDIPAFMVFSDKSLRDLILKAPSNEEELEKVYGFGKKKIDLIGKALLKKLNF